MYYVYNVLFSLIRHLCVSIFISLDSTIAPKPPQFAQGAAELNKLNNVQVYIYIYILLAIQNNVV